MALGELIEKLAMGGERFLEFDLHAVAREGAIPAGGVAQADDEIVGVRHLAFDLLARGKRDNGGAARTIFAAARIKHARFEIDRRIFADDASEVAGGRMTLLATPGSVEEGLA